MIKNIMGASIFILSLWFILFNIQLNFIVKVFSTVENCRKASPSVAISLKLSEKDIHTWGQPHYLSCSFSQNTAQRKSDCTIYNRWLEHQPCITSFLCFTILWFIFYFIQNLDHSPHLTNIPWQLKLSPFCKEKQKS